MGKSICTSFEDYIKNIDNITDYTQDGRCSNCGSCCSRILTLSDREYKNILNYIRTHNIHDQRRQLGVNVSYDNRCPFRDELNHRCVIYPVRPGICKLFMCNQSMHIISRNRNVFSHRYQSYDMVNVLKEAYDAK